MAKLEKGSIKLFEFIYRFQVRGRSQYDGKSFAISFHHPI
jgi:hypothetical protein